MHIRILTDSLAANQVDLNDIQSRIPAALSANNNMKSNVEEISGSTDAADKLEASAETMLLGTTDDSDVAATTTIFQSDDITVATADYFNGRLIIFTGGPTVIRQATDITDYRLQNGRGEFTVTALAIKPPDDSTFIIV